MCNVNDAVIINSQPFTQVIDSLITFIEQEEGEEDMETFIIGHGSYQTDFPILFVNCMKTHYDYHRFHTFNFVDSVQIFKDKGFQRPGLETLSDTVDRIHSAVKDIEILQRVIKRWLKYDDVTSRKYVYSFEDVLRFINMKLPITIRHLYEVADQSISLQNFISELYQYTKSKTALNNGQVYKIACQYFRDNTVF